MKLAALFSGGKDSTYVINLAKQAGHDVTHLVTIISGNPSSFMYHTANIGLTSLQSECLGIPLVKAGSRGVKEEEVKDLKAVLKGLPVDGITVGAIASKYQNDRVKRVCDELGLKVFAPLWGMDQIELLKRIIDAGFEVIFTAVAAEGLDESWLGRRLDAKAIGELKALNEKYGTNPAGEGGEYESLVIDCPMFKKKIDIRKSEKAWDNSTHSGYLDVKEAVVVGKDI